MTEFQILLAFMALTRGQRATIAAALGLAANDVATEEGAKRQFNAAKAAGKLDQLARLVAKP